jgi:hypothetical protein
MRRSLTQRSIRVALVLAGAFLSTHCQRPEDALPAVASDGDAACCELTPAADPVDGKGRIVVRYPDDGGAASRLDIYAAGDTSRAVGGGYGDLSIELDPGQYEATIGSKRIAGIVVQAGHDTRIRAGVLHVYASDSTRIDFLDPASGETLPGGYGEKSYGFPVGPVAVQVAGQTETVVIEDGVITVF